MAASSPPGRRRRRACGSRPVEPLLVREPGSVRKWFRELLPLGHFLDVLERGARERDAGSCFLPGECLVLGQPEPADHGESVSPGITSVAAITM